MTRTGIFKKVILGKHVGYCLIRAKRKKSRSLDDLVITDLQLDSSFMIFAVPRWLGTRVRVTGQMLSNGVLDVQSMGVAALAGKGGSDAT